MAGASGSSGAPSGHYRGESRSGVPSAVPVELQMVRFNRQLFLAACNQRQTGSRLK